MNGENILNMTNLKNTIQNNMNIFTDVNSIDKAYASSDFIIGETGEIKFRDALRDLVEKALNSKQIHAWKIDRDSIRFLGTFLGIHDFESNLFSSWILRVLMEQIVIYFSKISERHYKTFICWLYQEINIICNNPEVSREQFFEFMQTMFHQALTKILSGKGLLPLSNFIHRHTMIGKVEIKLGKINSDTGCDWLKSSSDIEEETGDIEASDTSFDLNFKHHEDSLYAIIEATYRIFADELNYELIQSAFESQSEILYYKLPYHCRKPIIVKRRMPSEKPSIESNLKLDKSKKKRKPLTKESLEMPQDILLTIDSASILNKRNSYEPEFILPLSEILEADSAMNNDESEEIKTDL